MEKITCKKAGEMRGGKWESNGIKIIEKVSNDNVVTVGNYSPSNHNASRIVDAEHIAPTVMENHGTVTGIIEPMALDEQNKYIRKDGTIGTLTTDGSSPKHNNRVIEPSAIKDNLLAEQKQNIDYRIRKLTPKECFRLMGVKDDDFERVAKNQSNSSLYHLAGDSIVVNVLAAIFKEML